MEATTSLTQGVRLPAHGRERGHVQRDAHRGATAVDHPFSLQLAAVAIEGRDADQFGNLLAAQLAQLRQHRQSGGLEHRAQALGRSQCWRGVLLRERFHPRIDHGQLFS